MPNISLLRQGVLFALRDWKRSGWLMLGLMLGLAFYVGVSAVGAGYTELVRLPFKTIESDLIVQLGVKSGQKTGSQPKAGVRLPFSNQPISSAQIEAISSLEGIQRLTPSVLLWYQEKKKFITLSGVDAKSGNNGPAKVLQWISAGRPIQKSGEAVVESHFAKFHKLKPGYSITFENHTFEIVGVTKIKEGAALAAANFYISIADARKLAGMEKNSANLLSITLARGVDKKSVKKKIDEILPGAIVSSNDSIGDMMQGFARISKTGSFLFQTISLVFILLISGWLIVGRLQEKRWQVGLMQALGWRKTDVVLTCAAETLALTMIGASMGALLGLAIVLWSGTLDVSLSLPWNLNPAATGAQHGGTGQFIKMPMPIILQPVTILTGMAFACLSAIAAGGLTAIRLTGKEVRNTLFEQ